MGDNLLLVLRVLDGQYFVPEREAGLAVYVEAKLGNDVLKTDQVFFSSNPKFDSELAFELNKKALQLHRVNRTPLKVQCLIINTKTNKKEVAGNLVLDLRSASYTNKDPKWYPLLNSKFTKHRPALSMAIYIENESKKPDIAPTIPYKLLPSKPQERSLTETHKQKEEIGINARDDLVTKVKSQLQSESTNDDNIKPILNSREGIYQIGPEDIFNEHYLFSITLAFAENLESLAYENADKDYYFFYSMFGNHVSTEKFKDLSNPNFPVERASVRVRANPSFMAQFFKQQSVFLVMLCCDEKPIANTRLLLKQFSEVEDFTHPKSLEGIFELLSIENEAKVNEPTKKPAIGISITLKKESQESLLINVDKALSVANFNSNNGNSHHGEAEHKYDNNPSETQEEYSVFFEKSGEHSKNTQSNTTIGKSSIQTSYIGCEKEEKTEQKDFQPHRYAFTIDLRSFQLKDSVAPFKCFFRYDYRFFGTTSPIETRPPIKVFSNEDKVIPHGYCSFNIITTPAKIEATFREIPLILEVLESTSANGKELNCLTGIGKLSLDLLNKATKENYTNDEGKLSFRQTSSVQLPVISLSGPILGTLSVVVTLDNIGLSETTTAVNKEPNLIKESIPMVDISQESLNVEKKPRMITGNDVLKAALELELWKEQQEILFRQSLKEREAEHLQALTAEWKKRDTDREVFVRKSLEENQKLEDKLKRALVDVELRERQLLAKENELDKNLKVFLSKVSKMENEAKDSIRRIKTECDYRIDLEKQKRSNLERELQKIKERNMELEKRLLEKENIIQTVQNKLNGFPEYQLQSDITTLHSEKEDLKKKLETAISAKVRYKEQWGKALRQISNLQQQLNTVEKNQLTQKVKELEKDKLKETALKEGKKIYSEKEKLEEIKNEVSQLKQRLTSTTNEENLAQSNLPIRPSNNYNPYSFEPQIENSLTTCSEISSSKKDPLTFLEGLMNEKQLLLESGAYKETDMVITFLDKRIKEVLHKET